MLPQLDISFYPSQIFWFLVSFGLTYIVVKKFIEPRYIQIIDSRDESLNQDRSALEHMHQQIEDIKKQYDGLMAELELKKQKTYKDSMQEFEDFAVQAKGKLEGDLSEKIKQVSKKLTDQRKKFKQEQKKAVIFAAKTIIHNITGNASSSAKIAALYNDLQKE